jgi:hypothetical protein
LLGFGAVDDRELLRGVEDLARALKDAHGNTIARSQSLGG